MTNRIRLIALVVAALFAISATATATGALGSSASVAKKCKKGYERVGKKCKKKPFEITPSSITLVAGVLKKGQFGATGYSYFPFTTRDSVLKGYWEISNGIGYQRLKVSWKVGKKQDLSNFTDSQREVGLTGKNMTGTLVVKGVRSNAFALKQD
jgi:hypothetical protein